jgi:hypothetical protein
LLPIAGWLEERARAVEITGGTDPILPTPFRIDETSAAALGPALGAARLSRAGVAGAGHVATPGRQRETR